MKDIIIVGFGGHAKSVADSIESQNEYRIVGYTDIKECDCEYEYLGTDDALEELYNKGIRCAAVGIGYMGKGNIRECIFDKLKSIGFELPVIVDPSAILAHSAYVGEGTFIGKGAIVNSESEIGKMTIINTHVVVEHECRVGDYSHIAVGAVLCGQVIVGRSAFIGANATIIQCMKIDDNALIPAGMTVR